MTVSSLWTVLDEAGCGRPVGSDDFDLRGRGDRPDEQTILAVDLSIWICEGIASTALSSFHSDPALYLVYQRTTKLLTLGLGLVFVVEGRRRVRLQETASSSSSSSQSHELRQRRSGSHFWNASERCESMLRSLGVPVVRAEAEGEALCALLNSTGLVDGVISNDGDCFLFGATTVYTNFSSEGIENRQVMRYDSSNLVANLDGDSNGSRTRKLSREDLVAFAMLCGSDMCGVGVPHCGHRKAVQFIHACRSLKHPCDDRTCLEELLSWADEAAESTAASKEVCIDCDDDGPSTIPTRCCSLCLHPGNKLQHEKHGCEECGTGPGEGCYIVTTSEKFLRSLKEKALKGSLAPRHIVNEYFSPNNNTVPSSLSSLRSKPYALCPDVVKIFTASMLFKGRSKETSHEYIRQTFPKLLARFDLWSTGPRNVYANTKQLYKPVPMRIEKSVTKESCPCYEITWAICINSSSEDEQFQFSTLESQSLVNSNFPQLVKVYQQQERRCCAEDERRKHFIGTTNNHGQRRNQNHRRDFSKKVQAGGNRRKRERNFDVARISKVQKTSAKERTAKTPGLGNDVSMLMDYLPEESFDEDNEDRQESEEEPEEYDEEECTQDVLGTQGDKSDAIDVASPNYDAVEPWSKMNYEMQYGHDHGQNQCGEITKERESSEYCSLNEHLDDILAERGWEEADSNEVGLDNYGDLLQQDTQEYGSSYPLPDAVAQHCDEFDYGSNHNFFPKDEQLDDIDRPGHGKTMGDMNNCSYSAGWDDDHLYSSGTRQDARGNSTPNNSSRHLSASERIYCKMGAISVEVTPMVSRRWRLL